MHSLGAASDASAVLAPPTHPKRLSPPGYVGWSTPHPPRRRLGSHPCVATVASSAPVGRLAPARPPGGPGPGVLPPQSTLRRSPRTMPIMPLARWNCASPKIPSGPRQGWPLRPLFKSEVGDFRRLLTLRFSVPKICRRSKDRPPENINHQPANRSIRPQQPPRPPKSPTSYTPARLIRQIATPTRPSSGQSPP
jgi:hypothetical protein